LTIPDIADHYRLMLSYRFSAIHGLVARYPTNCEQNWNGSPKMTAREQNSEVQISRTQRWHGATHQSFARAKQVQPSLYP
jgi:hypothetical protein